MIKTLNHYKLSILLAIASAWLTNTVVMAIEPVDGVYQIATAQDWSEFCTLHNTGSNQRLNAVLMADITVEGNSMVGINGGGKPYRGIFDGQGHKLIVNYNLNEDRVAPFRRINGATVKNVIVEGTITTTSKLASGLVGGLWQSGSLIQNCVSYVTINDTNSGDATHAGICASYEDVNGTNIIENCAFFGTINAPNRNGCGGLVGWVNGGNVIRNCLVAATLNVQKNNNNEILFRNNGVAENCYFVGNYEGLKNEKGGIAATDELAKSGQLCFLLNGNKSDNPAWFQTIGTDNVPSPQGKGIVYANGLLKCDGTPKGEVTFSNSSEGTVRDEHQWDGTGFCSACHTIQPNYLQADAKGFYSLASAQDLHWFAALVNSSENRAINARLTADVDFSNYQDMIGDGDNENAYQGEFDGQGYRVTVNYRVNQKNVALFRYLKDAYIHHLITDGTIQNENNPCSGGIFAGSRGASKIECCASFINFERSSGDDATVGGIGAYMHDQGSITNCGFYGSIKTPNATGDGGLLGYANGGQEVSFSHCLVAATELTCSGNSMAVVRNCSNLTAVYVISNGQFSEQGQKVSADITATGQLAYLLNDNEPAGIWLQRIGTDKLPLPCGVENGLVYPSGTFTCDGQPVGTTTFTNDKDAQIVYQPHQWEMGVCTVCGIADMDYKQPVGDIYELGSAADLVWYAAYAKNDEVKSARLTADIDFKDITFAGIGTSAKPFAATFDGQGHIISNLTMTQTESDEPVGFFGVVGEGAQIRNFTIDNSCSFAGRHEVGAFIGSTPVVAAGKLILEQLGNEATVSAQSFYAGGILGSNSSSTLKVVMNNCYNAGTIIADIEAGGLSGWLGDEAELTNCYNMGKVEGVGSESFARGNNINVANCFDPVTNWASMPKSAVEDFTNDAVFNSLYQAAPGIWFLSSEENGHPVLYNTGIVSAIKEISGPRVSAVSGRIYNLSGQRIGKPTRGFYIKDGKKYLR
ncbi:hypothetical protein L6472_00520 [Prevotella sp. E13-17]|uniref:hypothetical protein n=1 Tax=Prevotella sp. E13-17 TaxID=2913616 RepID=UPI001EDC269B|nr:hypothetical protein [Prevotella sp. E13-17]UKK51115.1 hypothetical protein L6472_00520 [Prevotella sp. E13-17]